MSVNQIVRGAAGLIILITLLLQFYNPWWLLITAFVGVNLLQSAFTDTCPLMWMLRKMGVKEGGERAAPASSGR